LSHDVLAPRIGFPTTHFSVGLSNFNELGGSEYHGAGSVHHSGHHLGRDALERRRTSGDNPPAPNRAGRPPIATCPVAIPRKLLPAFSSCSRFFGSIDLVEAAARPAGRRPPSVPPLLGRQGRTRARADSCATRARRCRSVEISRADSWPPVTPRSTLPHRRRDQRSRHAGKARHAPGIFDRSETNTRRSRGLHVAN
jgi:hypothetical protein